MFMDVFKSVLKTSLTGAMIFVSIVRVGMLAYPVVPAVEYATAPATFEGQKITPNAKSQVASPKTKRRVVMGQNSIENLGQSN
jgi:hypothetical protein